MQCGHHPEPIWPFLPSLEGCLWTKRLHNHKVSYMTVVFSVLFSAVLQLLLYGDIKRDVHAVGAVWAEASRSLGRRYVCAGLVWVRLNTMVLELCLWGLCVCALSCTVGPVLALFQDKKSSLCPFSLFNAFLTFAPHQEIVQLAQVLFPFRLLFASDLQRPAFASHRSQSTHPYVHTEGTLPFRVPLWSRVCVLSLRVCYMAARISSNYNCWQQSDISDKGTPTGRQQEHISSVLQTGWWQQSPGCTSDPVLTLTRAHTHVDLSIFVRTYTHKDLLNEKYAKTSYTDSGALTHTDIHPYGGHTDVISLSFCSLNSACVLLLLLLLWGPWLLPSHSSSCCFIWLKAHSQRSRVLSATSL